MYIGLFVYQQPARERKLHLCEDFSRGRERKKNDFFCENDTFKCRSWIYLYIFILFYRSLFSLTTLYGSYFVSEFIGHFVNYSHNSQWLQPLNYVGLMFHNVISISSKIYMITVMQTPGHYYCFVLFEVLYIWFHTRRQYS